MKTEYRLFCIVFLALQFVILCSCSSREKVDAQTIDRIVFIALPKGVEFVHSIDSFSLLKAEGRDTVITDRFFIDRFINEINHLEPCNLTFQVDLRSGAILYKRDNSTITIFFGENHGILYEGRKMADSETLFDLIDMSVYAPHSNDYWFPENVRNQMRYRERILREIQTEENKQ